MSIIRFLLSRISKHQDSDSEAAIQAPYKSHLNVFIVDDNIAFANILEGFITSKSNTKLRGITFSIKKYHNAIECLANIYQRPDVIILDYFLSSNEDETAINGDEVFKKIIEFNEKQKVVMLSGLDESNIVLQLIQMGLREYIIKDDDMFDNLANVILEIAQNK
ncbi:MAG: response regulator [Cytophagales bacterium]|nr:response regulator [Cytophagales bacterium]